MPRLPIVARFFAAAVACALFVSAAAARELQLQPPQNGASPSDRQPELLPLQKGAWQSPSQAPWQAPTQKTIVQKAYAPCDTCVGKVKYFYHRAHRCAFSPCDTQQVLLSVKDPCTCCYVEVPVCIPNCCFKEGDLCEHRGIFGRSVAEYAWPCGFEVRLVMEKDGDVNVHYYGLAKR